MTPSNAPGSRLPLWARAADALTFVLAAAAAYVTAFGGVRVGDVFSMSTPWRALAGLVVVGGLRHYFIRTPPLHRRVARVWYRPARWLTSVVARMIRARRAVLPSVAWQPPSVRSEHPRAPWSEALHVTALWCLAVTQPIFDLVGSSPEFFIAHDARTVDIFALVGLLCFGGPAVSLGGLRVAAALGGSRCRRRAATTVIGVLTAAVALPALKPLSGVNGELLLVAAALAGVLAAYAYLRFTSVRQFATFLAPAAIVVPALFLFSPGTTRFLTAADDVAAIEGVQFETTPPVVFIVFDELPLASLLDRHGNIDRKMYPHFAALADEATWFRNATAVAAYTVDAVPPILTGQYPEPPSLPLATEFPGNLFTLLGGSYRFNVTEPLTGLCPEALCPLPAVAWTTRLTNILRDLSIVYLTVVLPDDMTAALPSITQTWHAFVDSEQQVRTDQRSRWERTRESDRRVAANNFIESISATTKPALHFLHLALPHQPWIYMPTGQRFTLTEGNVGSLRGHVWADDQWAEALNYKRHLLQVGYVDALLGQVITRLRKVGTYDDALVVVTADHGISLQAGSSSRTGNARTFVDIMAVPLFFKLPSQRESMVVDANVEVVDIMPTVAGVLGTELPWTVDGSDVLDVTHRPRSSKVAYFGRRRYEVLPDISEQLIESVAVKAAHFAGADSSSVPVPDSRYSVLIGRQVELLRKTDPSDVKVVIDTLPLFRNIDPQADVVPAHITGAIASQSAGRLSQEMTLAVAINGVVAGVTRPYTFQVSGRDSVWEAIVDPGGFRPGFNRLEVFEVREAETAAGVEFRLAFVAGARDLESGQAEQNLIQNEVAQARGVRLVGFHGPEWLDGTRAFRWTTGDARVTVPVEPQRMPVELGVEVAMTAERKRFRVTVDGCLVFDEAINGRWRAVFDLRDCRLTPPELDIRLVSDTSFHNRTLGVGVGRLEVRHEVSAQ